MDTQRKLRIGISGSYGGMNMGDEAILEGILGALRASVRAEVTVFSRNPADTLERHGELIARIDRSWDTRAEIRAKIRERVPGLRARARQTNALLLRLLADREPIDVSQSTIPH